MNHTIHAQALTLPGETTITGPTGFANIGDLISTLIPYFFFFAGTAMLLMLIAGGFSLITGGSDPKKLESGKQKITYAIAGFFIVFSAYWVVQIAAKMFGLTEFSAFK
jgi:hypothetical protein